jgi:D-xylose reductase
MGFGCWKVPKDKCADAVYNAIKAGYRTIDEAADYGNEVEAGLGIKRAIDEGICKREDLWITSKLWNTYHRKENVETACRKTLTDMGLEYLDLYLIHFPVSIKFVPFEERYPPEWTYDPKGDNKMIEDPVPYAETWMAMEELQKKGLVKNIGCSNIGCVMLRDVLSYCTIKPAVLQVEIHPYAAQQKLIKFCNQKGIKMTAYSSFGAASYHELGVDKSASLLENPVVADLAKKVGKSAAQVCLRWGVQQGISVIPKTSNPDRLVENASVFDWELSEEDMKTLTALDKNMKFNNPSDYTEPVFGLYYPIFE